MLDTAFVQLLRAHQFVYETTDGLVGHRLLFGVPALLLRTTGRRTGKERVNALSYGRDGGNYLVTASNGGSTKPPAWLLNLTKTPQVEIQIGRRRMRATARPVLPRDEDYPRLWDIVNKVNRGQYREYQKKTTRQIAVVVLTPLS